MVGQVILVTTAGHQYTHKWVEREVDYFKRRSYANLFRSRTLPHATYIFGDFDRLTSWQLEIAGWIYNHLRGAGCRVLNNPARSLQRLTLLQRLRSAGLNSFAAWSAADVDRVDRFPVFLRQASAHRGVLTPLLPTLNALQSAVEDQLGRGVPLADLIVIEYRAQPYEGEVYRKLAMYRIGGAMVPAPSVHERSWAAKYGENGVAGEAAYSADLIQVREAPYAEMIKRAFETAHIEYGRADFGLVDGVPETYEINTNPSVGLRIPDHPFPARMTAAKTVRQSYLAALQALRPPSSSARVIVPRLGPFALIPRRYRMSPGYLWSP